MSRTPRKLPKIRLGDLDWKIVIVLIVLCVVTFADDVTGIGELLDPGEILVDVIVAYMLGKKAMGRAADREAEDEVVKGRVAYDPTASTTPGEE